METVNDLFSTVLGSSFNNVAKTAGRVKIHRSALYEMNVYPGKAIYQSIEHAGI